MYAQKLSRDRQGASGAATGDILAAPPLAYFITFTAYGTWLPGDERGFVHRTAKAWSAPPLPEDRRLRRYVEQFRMKFPPFPLTEPIRPVVDSAIRYACDRRGWALHELNVRTNHVHVVVSASNRPESLLTAFKAWSTRRIVEAGLEVHGRPLWTRHGSTRYVWTPDSLEQVRWYVRNGQGPDLPGLSAESTAGRSLAVAAQSSSVFPTETTL